MKNISITLIALGLSLAALSQVNAADSSIAPSVSSQATISATGVVKSIDAAHNKVTISHEAIKSVGWPAMTMGFTVRDKSLFNNLAIDKKVDFQLVKQGSDYVIVGVK